MMITDTINPAMLNTSLIDWPVIIQHLNDDELIFVRNESQWLQINQQLEIDDRLIDSIGRSHYILQRDKPEPELISGEPVSLEEVLGLVKAHAALVGSCCVAKLYAPSYPEAFKIIETMQADND